MCGIHGICVRGPRPGDQVIGHVVGVDVLQDLVEGLGAADQTVLREPQSPCLHLYVNVVRIHQVSRCVCNAHLPVSE